MPVLDARYVLEHPEAQLRALCSRLDLSFDTRMLHWPKGPRASDGVWSKYWYSAVEASTGFQKYRPKNRPIPEHLKSVHAEAQKLYERLHAHAIVCS